MPLTERGGRRPVKFGIETIRIVSAREADPRERRVYVEQTAD